MSLCCSYVMNVIWLTLTMCLQTRGFKRLFELEDQIMLLKVLCLFSLNLLAAILLLLVLPLFYFKKCKLTVPRFIGN